MKNLELVYYRSVIVIAAEVLLGRSQFLLKSFGEEINSKIGILSTVLSPPGLVGLIRGVVPGGGR